MLTLPSRLWSAGTLGEATVRTHRGRRVRGLPLHLGRADRRGRWGAQPGAPQEGAAIRQRGTTTVLRWTRPLQRGVRPFQAAAVVALALPLLVALVVQGAWAWPEVVGLAFAFAASTPWPP